jgi:phenylacetate-CoA ligase
MAISLNIKQHIVQGPSWLTGIGVFAAGFLYSKYRYTNGFKDLLRSLELQEFSDIETIRQRQLEKLKRICIVAFNTVPYYQDLFNKHRLNPAEIKSSEDLKQFPFLTKEKIKANLGRLYNPEYQQRKILHKTSGSTGQPLHFYLPFDLRWSLGDAHLYHWYSWHGFRFKNKRITIGGRYLGGRNKGDIFYNPFENQLLIGSHGLNKRSAKRYLEAMNKFNAKVIQGHPSAVARLVQLGEELGLRLPKVQTVFVTGETIDETDRNFIETRLGCKVFSQYGMGERAAMAGECEFQNGFHVDEMFGYVELEPHQTGLFEIVVTSLYNECMPFIRYRTGDLTRGWHTIQCPCGRKTRRLNKILGRIDDIITSVEGTAVLPVQLRTYISDTIVDMPPYSIIQKHQKSYYEVLVYQDQALDKKKSQLVMDAVKRWVGQEAIISLTHRPFAEFLTKGGKHRIICKEVR